MAAFFVTATGTEIGKTYISARLLGAARAAGHKVAAVKPLMSGFAADDLPASDAGQLLLAMGQSVSAETIDRLVMHRFAPALAPNVAARQAGVALDYPALLAFCRQRLAQDGLSLVEGAGGVMSPVTDDKLHSDLIADLGLPVILVSGNYLGTVSHTLSALAVLQAAGCTVAAIAVSQPTNQAAAPEEILPELARWTDVPVFAVPYGGDAQGLAAHVLA